MKRLRPLLSSVPIRPPPEGSGLFHSFHYLHRLQTAPGKCRKFRPGLRSDALGPRCAALLKIIDGLKPEDTGKFFSYDGKPMAW